MRDRNKKTKIRGGWGQAIMITVIIVGITRLFLLIPVDVENETMSPTLVTGDRMLINQINHVIGEPERQDIVVHRGEGDVNHINRIIGIPGDTVAYTGGVLYVNGVVQPEPYVVTDPDNAASVTEDFTLEALTGHEVVPEDHLFVLGDNRRSGVDSRSIGLVKIEDMIGTSKFIYWSDDSKRVGFVE